MLTREQVIEALMDQGLTVERLGAEGFEQAIADALRPREEVRLQNMITAAPSPQRSHGMRNPMASISPEAIARKRERLAAHRAQDVPPEPTDDDCDHCGGARFVRSTARLGEPLFGQAVPCPECAKRLSPEERWARAQVPEQYQRMTFETFASRFNPQAARPVWEWDGQRNLVLSGDTGRGKTHLAIAALRREVQERGRLGRWLYVPQLLTEIKRRYGSEERALGSAEAYIDRLVAWPLLVLDDLGAERATGWVAEQLTALFDRRLQVGGVTLVTTNLADAAAIAAQYAPEEDRMAGSRLASRIGPRDYLWVRAAGRDMRQYAAEDVAQRSESA